MTSTPESLTALDATFLELEEADLSAHMHIGAVMVFEARPGKDAPSRSDVAEQIAERFARLPRYSQRLSEPKTGGLSWPTWERDPGFEVAGQIRREALPAPGREPELLTWAGDYFSQRLDRDRPLWEMVILEGLEGGRWALATKTHHCMVDGVGSIDVGHLLLDAEPSPARTESSARPGSSGAPARPRPQADSGPVAAVASTARGAVTTAGRVAALPFRLARGGADLTRRALGVATHPQRASQALDRSRAIADLLLQDEVIGAPHTSLNDPIGARRRLAAMRVSLDELKLIKNELGGTVNDVVLAIAAGGFRDLLLGRGETPPWQGLRAMVPMNIRSAGEHLKLGNKITSLFVHLPVAERDPLRRYQLQVEEAETLKAGRQGIGSKTLVDLAALAPPALHSFLARSLFATRLFNVTITNVPGPQLALYAFGSRMEEIWPLVPLAASHAVGIAVLSYDGDLFFCVNADRDGVPDIDVLVGGMRTALDTLREQVVSRV